MKKIIALLIFLTSFLTFLNAQKSTPPPPEISANDYLFIVAKKTCESLDSFNNSNLSSAEVTAKLGYCMLDELMKFQVEFERDYDFKIGNITDMSDYNKIGQIVGAKMAGVCPDLLLEFSQNVVNQTQETNEESNLISENGTVMKIEDNDFVCFVIKTISGKIIKVYWMTFVENDMDLEISYKELINKPVSITYYEQELFDPKLTEYRYYNVLDSLILVK